MSRFDGVDFVTIMNPEQIAPIPPSLMNNEELNDYAFCAQFFNEMKKARDFEMRSPSIGNTTPVPTKYYIDNDPVHFDSTQFASDEIENVTENVDSNDYFPVTAQSIPIPKRLSNDFPNIKYPSSIPPSFMITSDNLFFDEKNIDINTPLPSIIGFSSPTQTPLPLSCNTQKESNDNHNTIANNFMLNNDEENDKKPPNNMKIKNIELQNKDMSCSSMIDTDVNFTINCDNKYPKEEQQNAVNRKDSDKIYIDPMNNNNNKNDQQTKNNDNFRNEDNEPPKKKGKFNKKRKNKKIDFDIELGKLYNINDPELPEAYKKNKYCPNPKNKWTNHEWSIKQILWKPQITSKGKEYKRTIYILDCNLENQRNGNKPCKSQIKSTAIKDHCKNYHQYIFIDEIKEQLPWYSCTLSTPCGWTGSYRKADFQAHMNSHYKHDKEKPYGFKCDKCGDSFNNAPSRWNHWNQNKLCKPEWAKERQTKKYKSKNIKKNI